MLNYPLKKIHPACLFSLFIFLLFCQDFASCKGQPYQDKSEPTTETKTTLAQIQMKKVYEEAKAAKDLSCSAESTHKKLQKEVERWEKKLMQMRNALSEKRKTLTAEEFGAKRDHFEKKRNDFMARINLCQEKFRANYERGTQKFQDALHNAIAAVAKERKIDVVCPSSAILYHSPHILDITQQVIETVDATLPCITLEHIGTSFSDVFADETQNTEKKK